MELNETVELMNSSDYKERFIAEYYQLKIRHEKLWGMLNEHKKGTLNFEPTTPIEILKEQEVCMDGYLYCLEKRAKLEGIEL